MRHIAKILVCCSVATQCGQKIPVVWKSARIQRPERWIITVLAALFAHIMSMINSYAAPDSMCSA